MVKSGLDFSLIVTVVPFEAEGSHHDLAYPSATVGS